MTLPKTGAEDPSADVAAALHDLARLVVQGVPGCDGAGVSLLREGEPSTLAASHDHVLTLDQAQYQRGSGPCVTAMHDNRELTVDDYASESRWPEAVDALTAARRDPAAVKAVVRPQT